VSGGEPIGATAIRAVRASGRLLPCLTAGRRQSAAGTAQATQSREGNRKQTATWFYYAWHKPNAAGASETRPLPVWRCEEMHGKAGPKHAHLRRGATGCLPVFTHGAIARTCRLGRAGRREERHWYPRGRTWEGAETRVSLRRGQAVPARTWPETVFVAEKMASRRRAFLTAPPGWWVMGAKRPDGAELGFSTSCTRFFERQKHIVPSLIVDETTNNV
jgi:hypothetical protein